MVAVALLFNFSYLILSIYERIRTEQVLTVIFISSTNSYVKCDMKTVNFPPDRFL
jgi:hypothetical protein